MTTKRPIYYSLYPVYEPKKDTFMNAAVQYCMATGKLLSGMGGGGLALSPEIVDALDARKNNHEARMICSAKDMDDLIFLAQKVARESGKHTQFAKRILANMKIEEVSKEEYKILKIKEKMLENGVFSQFSGHEDYFQVSIIQDNAKGDEYIEIYLKAFPGIDKDILNPRYLSTVSVPDINLSNFYLSSGSPEGILIRYKMILSEDFKREIGLTETDKNNPAP